MFSVKYFFFFFVKQDKNSQKDFAYLIYAIVEEKKMVKTGLHGGDFIVVEKPCSVFGPGFHFVRLRPRIFISVHPYLYPSNAVSLCDLWQSFILHR